MNIEINILSHLFVFHEEKENDTNSHSTIRSQNPKIHVCI